MIDLPRPPRCTWFDRTHVVSAIESHPLTQPLIPNLADLSEHLLDGTLAAKLAVAASEAESDPDLESRLRAVVEARLAEVREAGEDAEA